MNYKKMTKVELIAKLGMRDGDGDGDGYGLSAPLSGITRIK